MSATCTVCSHPKRKAIEAAHIAGEPLRQIAARFGRSRDSVHRHVKSHLLPRLAAAAEKKEIAEGSDLLERLLELNRVSRSILADAYRAGERETALKAIARLESQLELEARLIGEIKDRQVNVQNVIVDPETAEKMARMFLARRGFLEPHVNSASKGMSAKDGEEEIGAVAEEAKRSGRDEDR
jgi:hypothetical protein